MINAINSTGTVAARNRISSVFYSAGSGDISALHRIETAKTVFTQWLTKQGEGYFTAPGHRRNTHVFGNIVKTLLSS